VQPSANHRWRSIAALLVLGLVAGACGGGDDDTSGDGGPGASAVTLPEDAMPPVNTDTPQPGGTLVYGLAGETIGWDPSTSQWGPWGMTEARTFFDTLTIFDENGEIQPYLAESFTPNDDYSSWVVKLRPGVTFHNGEELTAQVLKDNWDFFTASPLVGAIFERIESTTVLNDLELRADMVGQWVNFPKAFTTQIGVVMAPESLAADGPERANNPIGTGPFVFDEWIQDRYLRVVKNDDYWQEGLPYLDEIEFQPIPDPTSRAQ
jgi:peptide/nickel transport system substrate-binding protein